MSNENTSDKTDNPIASKSRIPRSPTKSYTPLYYNEGNPIKTNESESINKEDSDSKHSETPQQKDSQSSETNQQSSKRDSNSKFTEQFPNVTHRKKLPKFKTRISCQISHDNKVLKNENLLFDFPETPETLNCQNKMDFIPIIEQKFPNFQKNFEENYQKTPFQENSFDN